MGVCYADLLFSKKEKAVIRAVRSFLFKAEENGEMLQTWDAGENAGEYYVLNLTLGDLKKSIEEETRDALNYENITLTLEEIGRVLIPFSYVDKVLHRVSLILTNSIISDDHKYNSTSSVCLSVHEEVLEQYF